MHEKYWQGLTWNIETQFKNLIMLGTKLYKDEDVVRVDETLFKEVV